jgi:hypothetical protein
MFVSEYMSLGRTTLLSVASVWEWGGGDWAYAQHEWSHPSHNSDDNNRRSNNNDNNKHGFVIGHPLHGP